MLTANTFEMPKENMTLSAAVLSGEMLEIWRKTRVIDSNDALPVAYLDVIYFNPPHYFLPAICFRSAHV